MTSTVPNKDAFAVIYRFSVKPGMEGEFIEKWTEGTALIRDERGGLGSRIHKDQNGHFIAYAKWPSRDKWKNYPPSSDKLKTILTEMNACLNATEVLFELDVVEDRWFC